MNVTEPQRGAAYETAAEQALYQATRAFFLDPSEKRYDVLEQAWASGPDDATTQATLTIQAANGVLDEECARVSGLIAAQGQAVACRAGCSACCKQSITCTPFEAALIGLYLADRPPTRAAFDAACREWDDRTRPMRESYMAWAERLYREGVDDGSHRLAEFDAPCPALHDDVCRIYPVRPYVCRGYISVSEACHTPTDPAEKPGMRGMEFSAHTGHKQAREIITNMLWTRFGFDPDLAKTRLMPELVQLFLRAGLQETLRQAAKASP